MKAHREVEAWLHSFLRLTLDESGEQHFPAILPPEKNPVTI